MNEKIKILKNYTRMCESMIVCKECKIGRLIESSSNTDEGSSDCNKFITTNTEEAIKIIEEWAAQHPVKIRQSEFLKQYPQAAVVGGVVAIDPCLINIEKRNSEWCHKYCDCKDCRKDYWFEEVEK